MLQTSLPMSCSSSACSFFSKLAEIGYIPWPLHQQLVDIELPAASTLRCTGSKGQRKRTSTKRFNGANWWAPTPTSTSVLEQEAERQPSTCSRLPSFHLSGQASCEAPRTQSIYVKPQDSKTQVLQSKHHCGQRWAGERKTPQAVQIAHS